MHGAFRKTLAHLSLSLSIVISTEPGLPRASCASQDVVIRSFFTNIPNPDALSAVQIGWGQLV